MSYMQGGKKLSKLPVSLNRTIKKEGMNDITIRNSFFLKLSYSTKTCT